MNKCIKITVSKDKIPNDFLRSVVQKHAQKFNIEGIAQVFVPDKKVRIIACGLKPDVDGFIDQLHKRFSELSIQGVEVEPYIKDKDYRNVFRIIE